MNVKSTPKLVSIVTPVHNSEKFLVACISSVQAQTYTEWEHILVDDCSTDKSRAIIEEFVAKDPRVKYLRLEQNSGAGVARNKAIEAAKGAYVAFLDSDDLWYPDKLEKQLGFMQSNSYPFTFTAYDKIDEGGNKTAKKVPAKKLVSYKKALFKNPIGCLTVIYSVEHFGKRYMPAIRKRQDYALWLQLLKESNAHGLDEVLSTYRDRKNSISSNKVQLLKYEWKIYREEEGLSFFASAFYLLSAIFLKLKSYF